MNQTEKASFVMFGSDSAITLDIIPEREFEDVTVRPNTLVIPAGEGTIRFSLSYDQIYMNNITLTAPENELIITDLSVVNESGGRLPYTIENGTEARGTVTLYRFGQPEQEDMMLFIVQYQIEG